MKTTDIFTRPNSKALNESIHKVFGKKLNLEQFDLAQLQDARNKLRTQISQVRSESSFNENLENDAYHRAQWMLDAINAEISERGEFAVEAEELDTEETVEENQTEASDFVKGVKRFIKGKKSPSDVRDAHLAKATFGDSSKKDKEEKRYDKVQNLISKESIDQGEEMHKVTEGEIQQASAIVTAKTMVDRVGRWIEELSGMENDTLLQLGDSIRDEMGQEQAKNFISTVAPAIQQALENLKSARETLSTGVRALTGEEQPAEMLGAEPEGDTDMEAPSEPDAMNAEPEGDIGDEFAAAEPAAGGMETAGREQRESIERQNNLLKVLAG